MMTLEQIDLTDLDFLVEADMYEAFDLLRAQAPVHWQERQPGRGFWSLTKYDDVLAGYRDPQTFSSAGGVTLHFGEPGRDRGVMGAMLITSDPPRHAKIRQVLSRRFTPRAVAPYESRIRAIASTIVDSIIERGECDFVVDVAALPTAVFCEMMAIGREHWDLMFAIANESIGRHDEEYAKGRSGLETVMDAQARASEFSIKEADNRRRNPGGDLMSALVHGSVMGESLDEAEIVANCWLLILGGQETTRNATSGAMLALLHNPRERVRFMAAPSAPKATEEFLRWTSPVTHLMRRATRDVEIRQSERVVLWNACESRRGPI
jgi:cytochrome P450